MTFDKDHDGVDRFGIWAPDFQAIVRLRGIMMHLATLIVFVLVEGWMYVVGSGDLCMLQLDNEIWIFTRNSYV